ncbi:hypothetical protein BURMUCF2_A0127 [Burkholderia multivorans CF2]|nr:hypothetical protein BURMUCF2_A0127 [Burkholderia multivorans CF2]
MSRRARTAACGARPVVRFPRFLHFPRSPHSPRFRRAPPIPARAAARLTRSGEISTHCSFIPNK